jgi:2-isopropylmalate synthase
MQLEISLASKVRHDRPLTMAEDDFNWNLAAIDTGANRPRGRSAIAFDETLRDGLQAPYVANPSTEEKLRLLEHIMDCGIMAADLGFPGSSSAAAAECALLARYAANSGRTFSPGFAGRTHPSDVAAICDIAQSLGMAVDAYIFTGVSPVRQYIEGWDIGTILSRIRASARDCERAGVQFVLVLEDTMRCTPAVLDRVYATAAEIGVRRLTLCDTVGVASPTGTRALITWTADYFSELGQAVELEWHGHNDRGLAVVNALTAAELGCRRVHGAVLGIGERAGNASIDQMLVNGFLEGERSYDLAALRAYCEYASSVLQVAIPVNYPAIGRDVFKTSAGVHAAAILKAHETGNATLKDSVYSSVPARILGREQEIQIDASSGLSNVRYWLATNGLAAENSVMDEILEVAKQRAQPLDNDEIRKLVERGAK